MNLEYAVSETKEITLQKDLPELSHAVAFYVRKGFTVTYNSAIEWKKLQYCDWHRIFSHFSVAGQREKGKFGQKF
ncbi:MAG: hypothetical protein ACFFAE_12855 [Candidatus Hodarchaeota archaeon]